MNNIFNWNKIKNKYTEDILINRRDIKEINIFSAYFSLYGVELLRKIILNNGLSRANVKVYISQEFSIKNCGEILTQLETIANTYIMFTEDSSSFFHSKLTLIKTTENKSFYLIGSSNWTSGGLAKNIEMNLFSEATLEDLTSLEGFMIMVQHKGKKVDQKLIDWFVDKENELMEITQLQNAIERKYKKIFFTEADPFEEEDYDFSNQYFCYKDFEAFFSRNVEVSHLEHRNIVREKLLDLNYQITEMLEVHDMKVYVHWSKNHITSLTTPQIFNHYMVEWMGIRYGKHEKEIFEFKGYEDRSEFEGFQKHACLQFSISAFSFNTSLFHAVPNGAIDRHYVRENLSNSSYKKRLIKVLSTLENSGAIWYIGSSSFNFNEQSATDFIEFYRENDRDGEYSYLMKEYSVDSDEISKSRIVNTIFSDFELYYPVYEVLAKRYL